MDFWEIRGGDDGYSDAGGVAIDASFTLHIADTHGELVRRFTAFGKELEPYGRVHERAEGAAARDRTGYLLRPHAVAEHEDVILVACGEHHLRRGVQRFGKGGEVLVPLAAFGDPEREYGAPRGLSAGEEGIFVADTLNGLVQRFTAEGRFVNVISTARHTGEVSRPIAVQALADGTLLVVDQGDEAGMRRYEFSGQPLGDVAIGAAFVDPVDLARDEDGRIYVLDRDGERVVRLLPNLTFDSQILDLAEYLHDG